MTLLALKLLLAPGFIIGTSLVSRRFGVRVGGVVAGLPAIAGPILLVVALDHGTRFASSAATGTLLGVVALMAFVLAYSTVSHRFAWPWALLAGWGSFAGGIFMLRPVHVGAYPALAFAAATCGAMLLVLPRPPTRAVPSRPHPPWDLTLRGLSAAIPVVSITAAARALGPHLTGLLASFPIITPVLAAFTHAQQGAEEAARLLYGMTVGFVGYALFCFTVSVTIRGLGIAASLGLAIAVALATQTAAIALTRRFEATAA